MTQHQPLSLSLPKRLCHLSIVADFIRRLHLIEIVDHATGTDSRMLCTNGECAEFILLAVFAGEHGLWRLKERLDPYDMHALMRRPDLNLEQFSDVRLERATDAIYDAGPERLIGEIAKRMIQTLRIPIEYCHFDTTTLSFYGAYESDVEDSPIWSKDDHPFNHALATPKIDASLDGDGRESPKVVHGYAKNKRHDLKQILYGSMVSSDGGIPLSGRAMHGNTSDITAAVEFMDYLRSNVVDPHEVCFVADSKGWTPELLDMVQEHNLRTLSRLPRTTTLSHTLLKDLTPLSSRYIRKQRKAEGDNDVFYRGVDTDFCYTITDKDGSKSNRVIPVRAVICYSPRLYVQKCTTAAKMYKKEMDQWEKVKMREEKVWYATEEEASVALGEIEKRYSLKTLLISGSVVTEKRIRTRKHVGRPRSDDPAPGHETIFQLSLSVDRHRKDAVASQLKGKATFILIRNRQIGWDMGDEEMIARYGEQWRCEHGFSWLKTHAAINPMFVKSPRRIAALCFMYTVALMVHALIQRTARAWLVANGEGLPYHYNKPSDRITTRFIFEIFRNVQSIESEVNGIKTRHVLGVDEHVTKALKSMGCSANIFG